jgi:hypothetical protein
VFGFLFEEYKPKYLYWEFLKLIFLKYLIIITNEITYGTVTLRTNSFIWICFSYYMLLFFKKPYKKNLNLEMEKTMLKIIIMT